MRSSCSPPAAASACSSPASIPAPRPARSPARPRLRPLAHLLRRSRLFRAQHARQRRRDAALGDRARFPVADRGDVDVPHAARAGRARPSASRRRPRSRSRWCPTACASSRGGRTAKRRDWCCRNISSTSSPRCACGSTPWLSRRAARRIAVCARLITSAASDLPARRQVRLGSINVPPVIRSLLFNALFYVNLHRSHGGGAADAFPAASDSTRVRPLLCANQPLAAARRLRHQGGVSRPREDSARRAASSPPSTSRCGRPSRCYAVLRDPAYILKRELMWIPFFGWYTWKAGMIPVNRGSRLAGAVAHDRARAARARTRAPDRHFSGRHAPRARRRAELQIRHRASLRQDRRRLRAGRAQFRAVLAAPLVAAAIPARSWSRCSIRFRPASTSKRLCRAVAERHRGRDRAPGRRRPASTIATRDAAQNPHRRRHDGGRRPRAGPSSRSASRCKSVSR